MAILFGNRFWQAPWKIVAMCVAVAVVGAGYAYVAGPEVPPSRRAAPPPSIASSKAARAARERARVVSIGPTDGADEVVGSLEEIRAAVRGLPRPGGPVVLG